MRSRSTRARAVRFDPTVGSPFGPPISMTDTASVFRLVSDEHCETLQRSREELLNIDWRNIVHPEDTEMPAYLQERLVANGEPYQVSARVRRGDGQWLQGRFYAARVEVGPRQTHFIQSSVMFDKPFEPLVLPADPVDVSDTQAAEYIQSLTADLARLAGRKKLTTLHHLLSMASMEAAEQAQRQAGLLEVREISKLVN